MVGIGRTVFSGTTLEEFKVRGPRRPPQRDRAQPRPDPGKLEGGPLAKTGVIAGMSGSPVYIDGRLVGAVSYQLGQFSTEPIAGITPIAEMTDATALSASPVGTRPVALAWPYHARRALRDLDAAISASPARRRFPVSTRADVAAPGAMLRPIAVPLSASGFEPDVLDRAGAGLAPRLACCRRPDWRRHKPRTDSAAADAGPGRRGRRVAALRRLRARRDRHGDPRGRGPRLRVRPPALQPRADRVSDDGGRPCTSCCPA